MPEESREELAYVFRGLGVVSGSDETGKGTAWKDADRGTGAETIAKQE